MMLKTMLAALAAVSLAGTAAAQQALPPPLYLLLYKEGPAWQAGKPMNQQALQPHGLYIRRLLAEGKLFAGGPMLDANGGMAVVRAGSVNEARAILAADPAIASGIFIGEVRTWMPLIDSGKPLKP